MWMLQGVIRIHLHPQRVMYHEAGTVVLGTAGLQIYKAAPAPRSCSWRREKRQEMGPAAVPQLCWFLGHLSPTAETSWVLSWASS